MRRRTFGDDLQTPLHGGLLFLHLDRLLKFYFTHKLLGRVELLADLRILRLEGDYLFQVGNGQLRFEDLNVTHRATTRAHIYRSNDVLIKGSRGGRHAPVVGLCILGVEFYGTRCARGYPVARKQYEGEKVWKIPHRHHAVHNHVPLA
jgi:hypothetical protein